MTTKSPSEVKVFSDDELIKKIYNSVEELKEYIPVDNDRNRLGYTVNLFYEGAIGSLLQAIDESKVLSNIEYPELEKLLSEKLAAKGLKIKEEN